MVKQTCDMIENLIAHPKTSDTACLTNVNVNKRVN